MFEPRPASDLTSPSVSRKQMRERIIAAATHLLQEHGVDAVTTRAVAAEAGVQAPTIYRLFGDKEGLLQAVAWSVFAAYVGEKVITAPTRDPVADLRAGWETHLEFGLANPDVFALLIAARHDNPTPAALAGLEILRRRVEHVAAAGGLRVPVSRAVQMVHAMGVGTVLALLAMAPEDRDLQVGDAVYDSLLRTIGTEPSAQPAERAVSSAAVTLQSNLPALTMLTNAERSMLAEWLERISDGDLHPSRQKKAAHVNPG